MSSGDPAPPEQDGVIPDWVAEQLQVDDVFHVEAEGDVATYGVSNADGRWRVRHALTAAALDGLVRSAWLHQVVRHPNLLPLVDVLRSPEGTALVHPWIDSRTLWAPEHRRHRAKSAPARFRRQPLEQALGTFAALHDAVRAIAAAGFVGTDFDDRNLHLEPDTGRLWLFGMDGFRQGSFACERPSDRRYAAPEERTPGATIDERAQVFQLAMAASELLVDEQGDFRGPPEKWAVIQRALSASPDARYPSVAAYVDAIGLQLR